MTGDEIVLAIAGPEVEKGSLKEWAHRTFLSLKVGEKAAGRGLLLVLSSTQGESEIEVGYGLESIITPEVFAELQNNSINPSLKEGRLDAAAIQSSYLLLESLNSPLIQSGEASELLQKDGVDDALFVTLRGPSRVWMIVLILGTSSLMVIVLATFSRKIYLRVPSWFKPGWLGRPVDSIQFPDQETAFPKEESPSLERDSLEKEIEQSNDKEEPR